MAEPTILKIAVVGPESTGKSTMAEVLAKHYQTLWVPEYAREYCSKLNRPYTLEDEINMMRGQLEWEDKALAEVGGQKAEGGSKGLDKKAKILFLDTTILSVKIWCDHVFGGCPPEVELQLQKRNYDLYLLMNIDMPWEDDPLREFPHLRNHFFTVFEEELKTRKANYCIITGIGDARYDNAIIEVDNFIKSLNQL